VPFKFEVAVWGEITGPAGFVVGIFIEAPGLDGIGAVTVLPNGCRGADWVTALQDIPSARNNNVAGIKTAHMTDCLKVFGVISDVSFLWN
jgi:hypothetical protein